MKKYSLAGCGLCIVLLISGCTMQQSTGETGVHPIMAVMQASQPANLPSGVFNWDQIAVQTTAIGQRRQFTEAPTATLSQIEMHVTTLNPGQQSHAPHRHDNEEAILLKEGTMEAIVNDKRIPMPTGSILFVAPNDLHAVRNVGTTPATYFVVAWRTPRTGGGQ